MFFKGMIESLCRYTGTSKVRLYVKKTKIIENVGRMTYNGKRVHLVELLYNKVILEYS